MIGTELPILHHCNSCRCFLPFNESLAAHPGHSITKIEFLPNCVRRKATQLCTDGLTRLSRWKLPAENKEESFAIIDAAYDDILDRIYYLVWRPESAFHQCKWIREIHIYDEQKIATFWKSFSGFQASCRRYIVANPELKVELLCDGNVRLYGKFPVHSFTYESFHGFVSVLHPPNFVY